MKLLMLIFIFAAALSYNSAAQQSLCDYKVEILVNNSEFEKESFSWRMKATKLEGKSTNITGIAEIDDSKGQIVKKYKPWTNESISKQKTSSEYSPNLKEGAYKIKTEIQVECDDTDKNNNVDVKAITIKEKNKEMTSTINQSNNQNIFIDEKAKNTIKNETMNQLIADKFENINRNKTEEPSVNEENNIILLKDNNDKKRNELIAYAAKEPQTVYESSNEKAKNFILISLLALSVFLNIILIWRR